MVLTGIGSRAYLQLVIGLIMAVYTAVSYSADPVRWDQEHLRTVLEREIMLASRMATNPLLVEAVVAQNAENLQMDEILARDKAWQGSPDNDPSKLHMLGSPASLLLKELVKGNGGYTEAFLIDIQGANVAVASLTSDYWQGDEDKFIQVMQVPEGKVVIGLMEWDKSSKSNSIQIAVPVKKGNQVIGVMIVGLKLSHVLATQLEANH